MFRWFDKTKPKPNPFHFLPNTNHLISSQFGLNHGLWVLSFMCTSIPSASFGPRQLVAYVENNIFRCTQDAKK